MEQQKILWTGLAAAFVLILVTLVAFLYMTSAKDNNPIAVSKGSLPASDVFKPIDPSAAAKDDHPLLIQTPTTPVSGFEGTMPNDSKVTLEQGTTKATDTTGVKATTTAPITQKSSTTPTSAKAATSTTPTNKASTTKPAATPAPKTPALEYYIQVGSYSSQTSAEEAKDDLKSRGLSSMIQVATVDKKDYYRVRIGPYQNKDEAQKFLDWIKAIKTYSGSYLTEIKN